MFVQKTIDTLKDIKWDVVALAVGNFAIWGVVGYLIYK